MSDIEFCAPCSSGSHGSCDGNAGRFCDCCGGSRRVGTATVNEWVEGWNQALEVCQADLRAALSGTGGDA